MMTLELRQEFTELLCLGDRRAAQGRARSLGLLRAAGASAGAWLALAGGPGQEVSEFQGREQRHTELRTGTATALEGTWAEKSQGGWVQGEGGRSTSGGDDCCKEQGDQEQGAPGGFKLSPPEGGCS